jgi:iron complex outermembrane receptor protein
MNNNRHRLYVDLKLALATVVLGSSSAVVQAQQLEEVLVTAQKRDSLLQDTPLSLNVLTESTLSDQNIATFDDYVQLLPNVSFASKGPGVSNVYMRGVAAANQREVANQSGSVPTVAIYLDEQPVTTINRNLDVHIYDVARIEVLSGPQGTLFGSSSMAGALRIITNKPDPSAFDGGFEGRLSSTKDGELNNLAQGFINLPISDRAAVRAVLYNLRDGGYIDNIPGTNEHPVTLGFSNDPATQVGTLIQGPNTSLAADDYNDVIKVGYRISGLYNISEDWSVDASVIGQTLETDGVFDYEERLGDLAVRRFNDDRSEDEFQQFSLTVRGRMGALDLLYSGSFLDREIDLATDYTGYGQVGPFMDFYTCSYNASYSDLIVPGDAMASCSQQDYYSQVAVREDRITHEFRVSTPVEGSLSAVAGIFYQDSDVENRSNWFLNDVFAIAGDNNNGFSDVAIANGGDGVVGPPGSTFLINTDRTEEQLAVFGEVTFELMEDLLAITGGVRWFDIESGLRGNVGGQFGPSGPPLDLTRTDRDQIFKLTLSFTPGEDSLYYATYSQGFRPGFFNRVSGPAGLGVVIPQGFDQDVLDNYEIGWKLSLMDRRVQFNGAAFFMDWEDLQQTFANSQVSNFAFMTNTADAEVYGIEGDFAFAISEALTLTGAFSWLNAELTSDFTAPGISDVFVATAGTELPFAPEFSGNLALRYEAPLTADLTGYAQGTVAYTGEQNNALTDTDLFPVRTMDAYTLVNAAVGVFSGPWRVELFATNLTDERAELFINDWDFNTRITTNRPRTLGARIQYDFQ